MRPVKLTVGSKAIGSYPTWAYPKGQKLGLFAIPTYRMTAAGQTGSGLRVVREYEVFRFGVLSKDGTRASVVGLANQQTHAIKTWIPTYIVHSAASTENGAWQVYDDFLIHDGPDNKTEVFASIGCVELVGFNGFNVFNDTLIELSGPSATKRADQLAEIGRARNITIAYEQAVRPALKAWS
jgi:hypothetical protein